MSATPLAEVNVATLKPLMSVHSNIAHTFNYNIKIGNVIRF